MSYAAAPFFFVVVGAPGAGKSSALHVQLAAPAVRRMVFDIEHEFGAYGRVLSMKGVHEALIKAGQGGPVSVVYQPQTDDDASLKRQFSTFCKLAFASQPKGAAVPLDFVCDELADVTSANPAIVPPAWSTLARKGRKRNIRVTVASQRPADMDKKVWSFQTRLRVGMLAYEEDVRQLAAVLMVPKEEVAALGPLQWIERDKLTAKVTRGRIEWRRNRPLDVPQAAPAPQKKVPPLRAVQ